jgi:spore maturation protein CgeB
MRRKPGFSALDIVIIGLSITSAWGNGHATTYRGLVRELERLGHRVLFLEHDKPWYAAHRDLPTPPHGRAELYRSVDELRRRFKEQVRRADLVIVGSYVPEGVAVGRWAIETGAGVVAFYDIDTPVTLAKLARGDEEYLTRDLIPSYDLYLSFTGGPTLSRLERELGSPMARALYCSVDPSLYYPEREAAEWDLGYLGTYSDDRQATLTALLLDPARALPAGRFIVAGPQYPASVVWPANVRRIEHLPPAEHRRFYNSQRFTLNVTRADMIAAGWSPSVRLFEAAACGTPIVSDHWDGLDSLFTIDDEILIARSADESLRILRDLSEAERGRIGAGAREKALARHTAQQRAKELLSYAEEARRSKGRRRLDGATGTRGDVAAAQNA